MCCIINIEYFAPRPAAIASPPAAEHTRRRLSPPRLTDGIGAPDPNPINLVNWCF